MGSYRIGTVEFQSELLSLTKKHSLFIKNGYELSQDGSHERNAMYDVDYYDFRIESFATAYADEQSACIPAEWED